MLIEGALGYIELGKSSEKLRGNYSCLAEDIGTERLVTGDRTNDGNYFRDRVQERWETRSKIESAKISGDEVGEYRRRNISPYLPSIYV